MDHKYAFITFKYKHGYIHTCNNRDTGKGEVRSQIGYTLMTHNTVAGAKRHITADYNMMMKGATK
jgi:hypothetical protein